MLFLFAIVGACFGSFISMMVWRLPRDEEVFITPSHCIKCNSKITVKSLVPILSWLYQKGKCASCGTKISAIYPVIEVITTICFIAIYSIFGFSEYSVLLCLVMVILLIISIIDLEHYIIPDSMQICLVILGIIYFIFFSNFSYTEHLSFSIILPTIFCLLRWFYIKFRNKDPLGIGDIKFAIAAGGFIPIFQISWFLLIAGISGLVFGVIWKFIKKSQIFPFGPNLCFALVTLLIYNSI